MSDIKIGKCPPLGPEFDGFQKFFLVLSGILTVLIAGAGIAYLVIS